MTAVQAAIAEHPVNRGATCRKPLRLPEALTAPDRATEPLWRAALDERFRARTWRQTVGELARRLRDVSARHGPDAIALYISGQLLTEDYYVATKLAKGFLGTNNVDSNSRLCMSSAVAGYAGALGSDGPPPSYADIDVTDHFLLLGSNASACHPILWSRIRRRQAQGATVTVIDPRRTPTAAVADLHLPVRPGADLPLLSAILTVLDAEGLLDREFMARHTEGADEALAAAATWTPGARVGGVRGARRGDRRRGAPVRRGPAGDGAVVDGREPVDGRDAQEPRADQPLPGHGQHRPSGHRAAVADRPAQRHGRPRVGWARPSAARLPARDRPRRPRRDAPPVGRPGRRAGHQSRGPGSRPPSSSTRSRTAA